MAEGVQRQDGLREPSVHLFAAVTAGNLQEVTRLLPGVDLNAQTLLYGFQDVQPGLWTLLHLACLFPTGREVTHALLEAGADPDLPLPADGNTPLMLAAEGHNAGALGALLAAGADVAVTNHAGRTALNTACSEGQLGMAVALLEAGANADGAPWSTWPPLVSASVLPEADLLQTLLAAGANVNLQNDPEAPTALYMAVSHGLLGNAGVLLQAGADPNQTVRDGFSPLDAATKDPGMVRLLLAHGADATRERQQHGFNTLHYALSNAHFETAELLLRECPACLTGCSGASPSPLTVAVTCGAPAELCLQMLCMAPDKAKLVKDADGIPLLHDVAKRGDTVLLQALLQLGLEVDARCTAGSTALTHACAGGHRECVTELLGAGANVSATVDDGQFGPMFACLTCDADDVLALLLKAGADPLQLSEWGQSTISNCVCRPGNHRCVPALVAAGVDVDHQSPLGATALYLACQVDNPDAVRTLLRLGCDPNLADCEQRTPLFCTAFKGHIHCMAALLDAGADPNIPKEDGSTPLQVAADAATLHQLTCCPRTVPLDPDGFCSCLDLAVEEGDAWLANKLLSWERLPEHGTDTPACVPHSLVADLCLANPLLGQRDAHQATHGPTASRYTAALVLAQRSARVLALSRWSQGAPGRLSAAQLELGMTETVAGIGANTVLWESLGREAGEEAQTVTLRALSVEQAAALLWSGPQDAQGRDELATQDSTRAPLVHLALTLLRLRGAAAPKGVQAFLAPFQKEAQDTLWGMRRDVMLLRAALA